MRPDSAAKKMNKTDTQPLIRISPKLQIWGDKKLGLLSHIFLMFLILIAPCWLFGLHRLPAWILGDSPLTVVVHQELDYRLHSDDFSYIGASRSWPRMVENLLVPHNTHICPSWRVLTWGVVKAAGDLVHLQDVMKPVSYLALALVMLQVGHFVAHESRSMGLGYTASVLVGVTSLQRLSTIWFSAGQTLWAGLFIVTALILTQESLRRNWRWLWPGVVLCCWIAGGFWTIGHAAGPTCAIYILAVTRGKRKFLALVPLMATLFAVAFSLAFSGNAIDATNSFHGRTTKEALGPIQGISHTCHSIIETLIFGNLGIDVITTDIQAVALTLILALTWFFWHLRSGRHITALEWTGAALCISAYWVEWSFRGYFSWVNLKHILYWYDSIPQIGWVMFLCGWVQAGQGLETAPCDKSTIGKICITRKAAVAIIALIIVMLTLHQPEVDRQLLETTPRQVAAEIEFNKFPTPELKRVRANYIWRDRVKRQLRCLKRFQEAERIAQSLGWGREDLSNAFGRLRLPEIPKVYDAVSMFDLPLKGRSPANPEEVRRRLGELVAFEPEKLPDWLAGSQILWPPKGDEVDQ